MSCRVVIRRERPGLRLTRTQRAIVSACVGRAVDREDVVYDWQVDLTYTDDVGIRAVNLAQRGLNSATDVLSFPAVDWAAGERPAPDPDTGRVFLGDIVLSVERMCAQAEENGTGAARELGYLVAHAALHLLGYDHESDEDRLVMRRREEEILAGLGLAR